MAEAPRHLWEYDHPYYCAEGNYFKAGQHGRRHPDPSLRGDDPDELVLHFVLQRKALLCSAAIAVTDDDEPAVRQFLQECAKTIAAIWEPVSLAVHSG